MKSVLDNGCLVLCATRRLSEHIHQQYAQDTIATLYSSPQVFAFHDWLSQLFDGWQYSGLEPVPTRLNPAQSLSIWEDIIQSSSAGSQLLQLRSTAKSALSAWRNLRAWQLSWKDIQAEKPDHQLFIQWCQNFETILEHHRAIDNSDIIEYVLAAIANQDWFNHRYQAKKWILVGFNEISPSYQKVIDALESAGQSVEVSQIPSDKKKAANCYRFDKFESECKALAIYAKQHQLNSQGQLGIVVPDLPQYRDLIVAELWQAFNPDSLYHGQQQVSPYFNVSAGTPLYFESIVRHAIDALQLLSSSIDVNILERLLLSPYFDFSQNTNELAAKLDSLAPKIEQRMNKSQWHALLGEVVNLTVPNGARPLSEWRNYFHKLWDSIGWPGLRSLSSVEHQAMQKFYLLLDKWQSLDFVSSEYTLKEAIAQLQRFCHDEPFQAQSKQVRIHVLGPLEAAGLEFDVLWLMRMHTDVWPVPMNPSPFIPLSLQQANNMPHARPERELEFCQSLYQQFQQHSAELICSYSHQEQGIVRRGALWLIGEQSHDFNFPLKTVEKALQLESVEDVFGSPVPKNEAIEGGASVLKNQALCPFRAYATHRLGAKLQATQLRYLQAFEKGQILHNALFEIWQSLKSHVNLCRLSDDEIKELIASKSKIVLNQFHRRNPFLSKALLALESQRLNSVLLAWMALEKQRDAFEIESLEGAITLFVNGHQLSLRLDRIDRLADKGYRIIDYKSGSVKLKDIFTTPLLEPQLPLYALSMKGTLEGVAFASLSPGKMEWSGISAFEDSDLQKMDLLEMQSQWRVAIESTLEDYCEGKAEIAPVNQQTSCMYCHLPMACRYAWERN